MSIPKKSLVRKVVSLTANDRCDACVAQAVHVVQINDIGKLMFCNHHYTVHKNTLSGYSKIEVLVEGA